MRTPDARACPCNLRQCWKPHIGVAKAVRDDTDRESRPGRGRASAANSARSVMPGSCAGVISRRSRRVASSKYRLPSIRCASACGDPFSVMLIIDHLRRSRGAFSSKSTCGVEISLRLEIFDQVAAAFHQQAAVDGALLVNRNQLVQLPVGDLGPDNVDAQGAARCRCGVTASRYWSPRDNRDFPGSRWLPDDRRSGDS